MKCQAVIVLLAIVLTTAIPPSFSLSLAAMSITSSLVLLTYVIQ